MKKELTLRERAVAMLARREHTRAELARKLAPHAGEDEDLEGLLDDLVRRKLLSDQRYAEARTTSLTRKFGVRRIEHELRQSGVSGEAAAAATASARATEVERAREAWRKRFKAPPVSRAERAKQMRFLQGRGFSYDAIRAVIAGADEDA